MGGDFQLLSLLEASGVLGLLSLFIIILLNLRRVNWLPITILVAGSLHYGSMFYFPGQIFFGYFLALRCQERRKNPDPNWSSSY